MLTKVEDMLYEGPLGFCDFAKYLIEYTLLDNDL